MTFEPLGDRAMIVRDIAVPSYIVASALNSAAMVGLVEAYAAFETVGVEFDPDKFELDDFERFMGAIEFKIEKSEASHELPVCYDLGPDLAAVAATLGLSEEAVIQHHTRTQYRCRAIGFCPGFAYLGPLPSALRGLPRLASPRIRIEPGSVGITGDQTAAYPSPRPGGWQIIGRCPLVLVDETEDYFPIRAGDLVRFRRIDLTDFRALEGLRLDEGLRQ